MAMSIDDEGYLSPDITAWIRKHRADNADWFALAGDLNRIAQCQLAKLRARDDDHQSLVIAMGAAQTRPDTGELLIQDDAHRRDKIAKKILSNHEILTEEDRALETTLTEYLAKRENSGISATALVIRAAAKMAGLEAVYDTYYAALSNDSAHPSLTSLKRHLSSNAESPGFRWGPDVSASEIGVAVSYACTACVHLIQIAHDRFDTSDLGDRIGEAWEQYKRLIDGANEKL